MGVGCPAPRHGMTRDFEVNPTAGFDGTYGTYGTYWSDWKGKEQGTNAKEFHRMGLFFALLAVTGVIFHRVYSSPIHLPERDCGLTSLVSNNSLVEAFQIPDSSFQYPFISVHMSALTSGVDSEQRFAAQALHRQSQTLQSNHTAHQHPPLPSDRPFPAHSQLSSSSMIGPTAPAAPYDPNVYPSYPLPERHQQDYEHFIMTQLSVPTANINNLPGHSAPNTIGRPPQAVYTDNTIERMVQRDPYAVPYATANPQAFLGSSGGGYAMQNQQNIFAAATNGPNYANGTNSYHDNQAPGGMYAYDPTLLLSPDSIHSIESPPVMMQQGPTRSHTMPSYYSPVNRTNGPSETEVPFSQIVARNNSSSPQTQTQTTWLASGSPTNPNYGNTGHFPVGRSTTAANQNGAVIAQHAVRKHNHK